MELFRLHNKILKANCFPQTTIFNDFCFSVFILEDMEQR